MADPTAAFVSQYVAELRDLTVNSKVVINTLTMLANENKQAAAGVAEAIEQRISTCAPQHKLPALYLLDSIVKNVGLPYTALFARDLPQVFMSAWNALPSHHPNLQRLYNTWHRFFPADVMSSISQQMAAPLRAELAVPSQQLPAASYPQQVLGGSLPTPPYREPQGAWPQQPVDGSHFMQPAGYSNGQASYMQMQQPQPMQAQQGQWVYPTASGPPPTGQYAAAYTPTYTPQYPGQQPQSNTISPSYPAANISPAYAAPAPETAPLPEFLSQLIGAGIIPQRKAPTGVPEGPARAPVVAAAVAAPTSFAAIKDEATAAAAVEQLLKGTAATKAGFLDLKLHRQRKRAAGATLSRQWFVGEADWLAGTTADAAAAPSFFDEPSEETVQPAAEASVPADPDQPNCGLSGEAFESVWDEASNGWRYKGATALDSEQAARYGLAEGTLVKVSCLGPSGGAPELEAAVDVVLEAEGQRTAEQVSAAAQEESAGASQQRDQKTAGWAEDALGGQPSPKKQRLG